MSWSGITKTYCPPPKKEVKKVVEQVEEQVPEYMNEIILKDVDDEFDYLYFAKINSIKIDFETYISENAFPFFDKMLNLQNDIKYNFLDYIKYNSKNFYKLKEEADQYNKKLIEEEENNDMDYDSFDFDDYV